VNGLITASLLKSSKRGGNFEVFTGSACLILYAYFYVGFKSSLELVL
jgi:hypothetical protein